MHVNSVSYGYYALANFDEMIRQRMYSVNVLYNVCEVMSAALFY